MFLRRWISFLPCYSFLSSGNKVFRHLKLNITLCVLEVVVPPSAKNLHLQTAVILLSDGSDGISTGGQGIVTIVIGNSRQMQSAFLARSFEIVEDAVFVLEQRFLRIEKSCESVC